VGKLTPAPELSPDIIDRRDGQPQTMADKMRDIVINVRDEYNRTIGAKSSGTLPVGTNDASGLDDAAVARIHANLKKMFGN
jgi:hypothetical protein